MLYNLYSKQGVWDQISFFINAHQTKGSLEHQQEVTHVTCNIQHQLVAQHYSLINAPTCFSLTCWPS